MKAKKKSGKADCQNDLDERKTIPSKETYRIIGSPDIPGIEAIKKAFLQKKNILIHGIINSNEWS